MPIAVQSVPFLVVLALCGALLGTFAGWWWSAPFALLAVFVAFFFRDPERSTPAGEGLAVSPADGRVIAVERGPSGARVSIFLSVFNCHINRAPVDGVVTSATYTPGRYLPAWDRRVERENERNHLVIQAADGAYAVTQIAGILARRIVCSKKTGDPVARGERIGLIQFGSRTDLHLPQGMDPVVRAGDRVRGAVTVLARTSNRAAAEPAPMRVTGSGR